MEVINAMRVKLRKRRGKFRSKLGDIPEIGLCDNQVMVNRSLGDLLEDELFLVPGHVLDMDSFRVREDLSTMAGSKSNAMLSTRPDKSLTLLQDRKGIFMARASQGCSTLWICKYNIARTFYKHL